MARRSIQESSSALPERAWAISSSCGEFAWIELLTLFLLLLGYVSLLVIGQQRLSTSYDERGHLVAGIAAHRLGTLDVYSVNGPIVKLWATLPIAYRTDLKCDWSHLFLEHPDRRGEFLTGDQWIEDNPTRYLEAVRLARSMHLIWPILGATGCWCFLRKAGCRWLAMGGILLWILEPTILGHSLFVGTDIPAISLLPWLLLAFAKTTEYPSTFASVLLGCLLGVAIAVKFVWVIGLLAFPICSALARFCKPSASTSGVDRRSFAWDILVVTSVAIFVLNACYGYQGSFRKIGDYSFYSPLLKAPESEALRSNRLKGTLLEKLPLPLPSALVMGADLQWYQFEMTSRQRKSFSDAHPIFTTSPELRSCTWFYLYAFWIKSTIGMIAFCIVGLIGLVSVRGRIGHGNSWAALVFFGVTTAWISWASAKDPHYRYALPIVIGAIFASTISISFSLSRVTDGRTKILLNLLVGCLLLFHGVETLYRFPHLVSFANVAVGGPEKVSTWMRGTNVEYGTGLFAVRDFLTANRIDSKDVYVMVGLQAEARAMGITGQLSDSLLDCPVRVVTIDNQNSRLECQRLGYVMKARVAGSLEIWLKPNVALVD